MNFFRRARTIYLLHRYAIKHDVWEAVTDKLLIIRGMTAVEKAHLRELSTLFLCDKNIYGAQGFLVTAEMGVTIAVQACLPVLALGLSLLDGWSDIIIYADAFRVNRDETDEFGIVHHGEKVLSGEAWSRGPVILSWHDIESGSKNGQGSNVVVHEIAHKLDGLNGRTNGMPPLHYSMKITHWTAAFSQAYQCLNQRIEHHHPTIINSYAATSPAECFAVFSEYFFSAPDLLEKCFSDVYQQLKLYYRQDPLTRLQLNKTSV